MLTVYCIVFITIGITAFYKGYKEGEQRTSTQYENHFKYVTIRDLEDMVAEMKANGAGPDAIFVTVKADWDEELLK